MELKNIEEKAVIVRDKLITAINNLMSESSKVNVIKPDNGLKNVLTSLQRREFNVVVCGEVKHGKSTFVNAIVGKDFLPTGVKETTSQVFKISNAAEDSFSLVFKDGTQQEITKEELVRYGSQVDADLYGEPLFEGRMLSHIQINANVEFLPDYINLVDTPGLGALYAAHSEITKEQITEADAVVFIVDPLTPITTQEKEFLESVFEITPYVLFVMTKIDLVKEAEYVNMMRRDEAILQDAFSTQCYTTPIVYPVDSMSMTDAGKSDNDALRVYKLKESNFNSVKDELLLVMHQAVALVRNELANFEAVSYYNAAFPGIEEQLKMVASQSQMEQEQIKNEKQSLLDNYKNEWGPDSPKRRELYSQISSIIEAAKKECYQIFDPECKPYKSFRKEIIGLSTAEEVHSYSKNMGSEVINAINAKWNKIVKSADKKINELFYEFRAEINIRKPASGISFTEDTTVKEHGDYNKFGFRDMMRNTLPFMGVGSAATLITGISFAPVLSIALIVGGIWNFFKGKKQAVENEVGRMKGELQEHLNSIFKKARKEFTKVSVMNGKYKSMVDAFAEEIIKAVESEISNTYETKKSEYEKEKNRLEEQSRMNAEQRKKELAALSLQRTNWLAIGDKLKNTSVLIIELKEIINSITASKK